MGKPLPLEIRIYATHEERVAVKLAAMKQKQTVSNYVRGKLDLPPVKSRKCTAAHMNSSAAFIWK